jgi:hypothetical protein
VRLNGTFQVASCTTHHILRLLSFATTLAIAQHSRKPWRGLGGTAFLVDGGTLETYGTLNVTNGLDPRPRTDLAALGRPTYVASDLNLGRRACSGAGDQPRPVAPLRARRARHHPARRGRPRGRNLGPARLRQHHHRVGPMYHWPPLCPLCVLSCSRAVVSMRDVARYACGMWARRFTGFVGHLESIGEHPVGSHLHWDWFAPSHTSFSVDSRLGLTLPAPHAKTHRSGPNQLRDLDAERDPARHRLQSGDRCVCVCGGVVGVPQRGVRVRVQTKSGALRRRTRERAVAVLPTQHQLVRSGRRHPRYVSLSTCCVVCVVCRICGADQQLMRLSSVPSIRNQRRWPVDTTGCHPHDRTSGMHRYAGLTRAVPWSQSFFFFFRPC